MKVKQCMKITETRIHLTDAENNLVAECPEAYAQDVEDALNKYDTLLASHEKLVEALEKIKSNEIYLTKAFNELGSGKPIKSSCSYRITEQALKEAGEIK